MANPKREMKFARKTYRLAKKDEKKNFNQAKRQAGQVFKTRRQQAEQLFSNHPEQLATVHHHLKSKRTNDRKQAKQDYKEAKAAHKQTYIEQVLSAPPKALTARELKKHKLPDVKRQHNEVRERFIDSKKALKKEQRQAIIATAFSYGRGKQQETNFGRRQTNFQSYQAKQSTVRVHQSTSERAKQFFSQAQGRHYTFNRHDKESSSFKPTGGTEGSGRFYSESSEQWQSQEQSPQSQTSQQRSYRFKRQVSDDSKIKQTQSGRFWYESDTVKEKKAESQKAKAEFKASKQQLKQTKKVYHYKRPRTKLLKAGRFITKEIVYAAAEDEDLRGIHDIDQTVKKTKQYSKFSYRGTTSAVKAVRGTYRFGRNRVSNLVERSKNFRAGKGFVLNDPKRHLNQRIVVYAKNLRTNLVNSYKKVVTFIKNIPQILANLAFNPMAWAVTGGFLFLVLFISLFLSFGSQVLIHQDEFELNKSYTHMTLLDAEHSISNERGTIYYTKVDDVMAYMNYKYQDYELSHQLPTATTEQLANLNSTTGLTNSPSLSSSATFKDYLTDLWSDLNEGERIKSMEDLYKEDKYALTDEEIEELAEYKEEGIYVALFELDNPFQGQGDSDAITMTYRYGYHAVDGKPEKSNHIILQASKGQVVVAPMDGLIKLDGNDVLIVSSEGKIVEARLRLKDIVDGSVQDGQKVYSGDVIGSVQSDQGLTVLYQKYNDHNEKLVYVNPAFYFPNVVQLQTTIIASIGQFQGDEVARAKQIYEYLKAKGASNQFIAGVLGNWSVESAINPKRAEGDYLSPPVGATETSWDDPSWLAMGGPAIYNGGYPNIIHRGLGLGQWTDTADGAIRHTLLRNYADSKGKKWYDLDLQLEFMLDGDSPYYTNWVKTHMGDSGSPAALAQLFLIYWEGNAGDKLIERQTRAIEWFYQIEKGFTSSGAPANVDSKSLESIRGDLYGGVVPGGGDDMGYPWGQCTWYVAKRVNQLGLTLKGRDGSKIPIISTMGNGMDWAGTAARLGGETGSTPREGALVSFDLGDGYGHVAFVEKVYADGSFLVSEANYDGSAYNPTGNITFRTLSHADASMSFAYTTK